MQLHGRYAGAGASRRIRGRPRFPAAAVLGALAALAALGACATRPEPSRADSSVDWRLVPESTVLGDRRQFFVYGRGLDSARVTAADGVAVERGWLKEDGKVLSLYLTVGPLGTGRADSAYLIDKPGLRKLRVETRDTVVILPLKVLDEAER